MKKYARPKKAKPPPKQRSDYATTSEYVHALAGDSRQATPAEQRRYEKRGQMRLELGVSDEPVHAN